MSYDTTPADPRFATSQNKNQQCWTHYNEYLICASRRPDGIDDPQCQVMRAYSKSICPNIWFDKWEEAREEGAFFGVKFWDEREKVVDEDEEDDDDEEEEEEEEED